MENALLDLLNVLIVCAIGFGVIMMVVPLRYGGIRPRHSLRAGGGSEPK